MTSPVRHALLLAVMLIAQPNIETVELTPSEILSDPARFDGQRVTVTGTVTKLRTYVSRRGAPYYIFHLSDNARTIPVVAVGPAACQGGASAKVEGQFVRVPGHIDATMVACR